LSSPSSFRGRNVTWFDILLAILPYLLNALFALLALRFGIGWRKFKKKLKLLAEAIEDERITREELLKLIADP